MSTLEVKNFYCLEFDITKGPKDFEDFYCDFRVDVGTRDSNAVTNYSLIICSTVGIARAMSEENWNYLWGRHHLIVARYDLPFILRTIKECVADLEGLALDVS